MGAKRDFALIKHSHDLGTLLDLDLTGLADNSLLQYDSTSGDWQDVTVAGLNGQLDHGTLLGLADDDHPQYALDADLDNVAYSGSTSDLTEGTNLFFTDERAQDAVFTAIADSSSIDVTYNDVGNSFSLATINANPSGLIGMSAVNGTAATPLRSDGLHAIDPAIAPTWTGKHTYTTGGIDVASTSTPGFSMDGQKWQCFAVLFVNTAGTIQHQIVNNGLLASAAAYADRIIGASATLANTPTNTDASNGFTNGVGLLNANNYAVIFNTAAQGSDNVNAFCSYYDGNATRVRIIAGNITRNVNGNTVNRLELRVLDEMTGAAAPINTTLLPAGKFMVIQIMGFLA